MILIQRGKEPDSLLQYRKSEPNACYEELPKIPRDDIRKQMWEEQRHLCAYCMRKINSPEYMRIEHYNARNPEDGEYDAKETLNFKKMLGVCYGNSFERGVKENDTTCDAHKKNTPLTVNPYRAESVRRIRYTTDGYITSDDLEIKRDVEETLNLNCKASSLPETRKRVLLQAKAEIIKMCGHKNHMAYLEILNKVYEKYMKERALIPYCGITIAWLEKELGIV